MTIKIVELPTTAPNQDILDMLVSLMDAAADGKLVNIFVIANYPEGPATFMAGSSIAPFDMIGYLERLKYNVMKTMDEDYERRLNK